MCQTTIQQYFTSCEHPGADCESMPPCEAARMRVGDLILGPSVACANLGVLGKQHSITKANYKIYKLTLTGCFNRFQMGSHDRGLRGP